MKQWKAEFYLFFMTFIWGGTFTFTKLGLVDCPPSLFVSLRFIIALVLALAIFGKHLKNTDRATAWQGLLLGLMFCLGFLLQTYGLKYTSVSKSAFITGITVSFTPFVFKLVEKKAVGSWQKIGVVIATAGLWLFTRPDFNAINYGDLMTLISTIFWALYITYMDVFTRGKNSFSHTTQLVVFQFIAFVPVSLLSYFIFDYSESNLLISNNLIMSLAYNAILASFLLTFIHTSVQRYSTPVKAALIFSLEPVIASIIGIIVFNEVLSGREYTGAAILMLGVVISQTGKYFTKKQV